MIIIYGTFASYISVCSVREFLFLLQRRGELQHRCDLLKITVLTIIKSNFLSCKLP